jgi:Tol biopolymer transport system component
MLLHLLTAALLAAPSAPPPEQFLVHESGLAYLGLDGREAEKVGARLSNGALSPDGGWLACLQEEKGERLSKMVLRPRGRDEPSVTVPEIGIDAGEGCLPVWSPDSKRLFVGETRAPGRAVREYRYRIYDLATKKLTEVKLPEACWVTDWSKDGKQWLVTAYEGIGSRLARVNADGKGGLDYITPEGEDAAHARLSPDGRKILYKAWIAEKENAPAKARLCVLELATKKRVPVDEPGEVAGYCWSPDGSRVAYTWQRSLARREDAPERETFLFTCDPDGKDRKTVTSRKYKPVNPRLGVVWFFELVDWR